LVKFPANICLGNVLSGIFADINWEAPRFIQAEMYINGVPLSIKDLQKTLFINDGAFFGLNYI